VRYLRLKRKKKNDECLNAPKGKQQLQRTLLKGKTRAFTLRRLSFERAQLDQLLRYKPHPKKKSLPFFDKDDKKRMLRSFIALSHLRLRKEPHESYKACIIGLTLVNALRKKTGKRES
jgi:hypothetical protein